MQVLLFAALLVQGSESGVRSSLPAACKLYSRAEAQKVIGEPVRSSLGDLPALDAKTGTIVSSCLFAGKSRSLIIAVALYPTSADAHDALSKMTRPNPGAKTFTVGMRGIGDEAFFGGNGKAIQTVARKGARSYSASITGPGADSTWQDRLGAVVSTMAGRG